MSRHQPSALAGRERSTGGHGPGPGPPGWGGGGSGDGQGGGGEYRRSPNVHQIAVIAGLVSITAFFVALTLAFVLTMRPQDLAGQVRLPNLLLLSTSLLLASSATLELARSSLRLARVDVYLRSLWATIALGTLFVALQVIAWTDIAAQGLSIMGGRRGAAFYVFTGAHALHILGGLGALVYLLAIGRSLRDGTEQQFRSQRAIAKATAMYWHFMGLLWLGLYALLQLWYEG